MIVIAATILGALLGATTARRRRGNRLDMLQYGAGYAIAFALLGLFLTIFVERML